MYMTTDPELTADKSCSDRVAVVFISHVLCESVLDRFRKLVRESRPYDDVICSSMQLMLLPKTVSVLRKSLASISERLSALRLSITTILARGLIQHAATSSQGISIFCTSISRNVNLVILGTGSSNTMWYTREPGLIPL